MLVHAVLFTISVTFIRYLYIVSPLPDFPQLRHYQVASRCEQEVTVGREVLFSKNVFCRFAETSFFFLQPRPFPAQQLDYLPADAQAAVRAGRKAVPVNDVAANALHEPSL